MLDRTTPWFLNFGGGTNSSALACEAIERGLRPPAAVFFADTGGERPRTYEHVEEFSEYLKGHGWPGVTTVRWIRVRAPYTGQFLSLEDWCLQFKSLPSLAFGRKGCSVKWKAQPVDKAVKAHPAAVASHAIGVPVIRALGYDADEPHRWNRGRDDQHFRWWAPLVEWDMGREECVEVLARHGFSPGKSACFFCPGTKRHEILALGREEPELLRRALVIEDNADLEKDYIGLGGTRRWYDVVNQPDQQDLWPVDLIDTACGCYDG